MQPLEACLEASDQRHELYMCIAQQFCRMSIISGYNLGIATDLAARNYIAEQYVYTAEAISHRVGHLSLTICLASDCT